MPLQHNGLPSSISQLVTTFNRRPRGQALKPERRRQVVGETLEKRELLSLAMLTDINQNERSSLAGKFTQVGSNVYFIADDGVSGLELWKSDGTEVGTTLVKDILPGRDSSFSSPADTNELIAVGDTVYFRVGIHSGSFLTSDQLWKSDGTAAGTVLIKSFTANGSDSIDDLTAWGNKVYFSGPGSGPGGLWQSDGTASGTVLVSNVFINSGFGPLTPCDNAIYFTGYSGSGTSDNELWRTDGTTAGTVLVKDIQPGTTGSYPSSLMAVGSTLFFSADDGVVGRELWKSDGSAAGTQRVKDIYAGTQSSNPSELTPYGDRLAFTAGDSTAGTELWLSDGTDSGTYRVKDIYVGANSSFVDDITVFNNVLYFAANDYIVGQDPSYRRSLWRSDGTASGTSIVIPDFWPDGIQVLSGQLILSTGADLWKSNGTDAGTVLLTTRGIYSSTLTCAGASVFFSAYDPTSGFELWKSDGTPDGTTIVRDIRPGTNPSTPSQLTVSGSALLFVADDYVDLDTDPNQTDPELWKTDGTPDGTDAITALGDTITNTLSITNTTFFTSVNSSGGLTRLWATDGTSDGTTEIQQFNPGNVQERFENLTAVGKTLFFNAPLGTYGNELWKSDGTAAGTVLVKDISPGSTSSDPSDFVSLGNTLYFTADDGVHGRELWKSDGTAAGTVLVKDIWPGSGSSNPTQLTAVGSTVFFVASDGTSGYELWKTDGTEGGTARVKDIVSGSGSSYPDQLTAVGNALYFILNNDEVWQSDGTDAGTFLVREIQPGSGSSYPTNLTALGSTLYFTANDGTSGVELWRSNGTAAGTIRVKDIRPGSGSSSPDDLYVFGSTLYFSADDGVHGRELWQSDGTDAGTVLLDDINPGPGASNPSYLTEFNGTLYFAADDGLQGQELWFDDTAGLRTDLVDVVDVSPDPRTTRVSTVDVVFSNPIDLSSFTYEDLVLQRDGNPISLNASVTINLVSGTTYRISGLAPFTDISGNYFLGVRASGVLDRAGKIVGGSASDSWQSNLLPEVQMSVISSAPTSTYGQSITFTATLTPPSGGATPTGTVQFVVDSLNFGSAVALVGGTATSASVDNLGAGSHIVEADYSGDSNYLDNEVSLTQIVNQALLTVTANPQSKVYGNSDPALTYQITSGSLVGGDTLGGNLSRDPGETVASSPYVIRRGSLSAGSNYSITFFAAYLAITPRVLHVTATADARVYDGTTAAVAHLGDDRETGDVLTIGYGTATFADKNTGTGKPVTVTGITVTGTDAGNYTFNTSTTATADITARPITVTAATQSKVYGNGDPALTFTVGGDGLAPGDTQAAVFSGGLTRAAGESVAGNPYAVAQGSLAANGNYSITSFIPADFTVTPRVLHVTATADARVYDGTTAAVAHLADDRKAGDVLTIGYGMAAFADKNAGTGKPATVTGITVTGTDAGNYTFKAMASTTANITVRALTVSATSVNKTYDGTTTAAVTLSDNRVIGDVLTIGYGTATFADKNAGTGKPVTVTGITVTGTDAGNYTFNTSTTATADITARPITVTAATQSKVYGNGDPALTFTVGGDGLAPGDTQAAVFSGGLTRAAGESVAGNPYAVAQGSLAANGNYSITSFIPADFTVTPRVLHVTATADARVYDGTTAAVAHLADDRKAGDVLTIGYGTASFADKNTATGKPVTVTGITVTGTDAGNYTFNTSTTATADITARPITVTAATQSKVYGNGDPALTFTVGGDGLAPGDTQAAVFSGGLTRAAGESVAGNPYAVAQGSLAANGNYSITSFIPADFTITPRVLHVTATADARVYDGTTAAVAHLADDRKAGDVLTIGYGTASFADKNTATGKPVTVTGITVTGTDAGNYTFNTSTTATADITARPITIRADAQTKYFEDADPTLTYTITMGNLVGSDTLSGSLSRDPTETPAAASYAIRQGTLTAGDNYDITFIDGTLTVTFPTPPLVTVTDIQMVLNKKHLLTQILVTFSGTVNAGEAENPGTYRVAAAGKNGSFTTKNAKVIMLRSAAFDSTSDNVTLTLEKPFKLSKPVQLQVNGTSPSGLEDGFGRLLDGNHDGEPGGDASAVLSRGGARIGVVMYQGSSRGLRALAHRRPPGASGRSRFGNILL